MKEKADKDNTPHFSKKDKKAVYPPSCSAANQCPVCGSRELEYGSYEVMDDSVIFPWKCKACGYSGCEWGAIHFDGHDVDCGPDGEELTEVPNYSGGKKS